MSAVLRQWRNHRIDEIFFILFSSVPRWTKPAWPDSGNEIRGHTRRARGHMFSGRAADPDQTVRDVNRDRTCRRSIISLRPPTPFDLNNLYRTVTIIPFSRCVITTSRTCEIFRSPVDFPSVRTSRTSRTRYVVQWRLRLGFSPGLQVMRE